MFPASPHVHRMPKHTLKMGSLAVRIHSPVPAVALPRYWFNIGHQLSQHASHIRFQLFRFFHRMCVWQLPASNPTCTRSQHLDCGLANCIRVPQFSAYSLANLRLSSHVLGTTCASYHSIAAEWRSYKVKL